MRDEANIRASTQDIEDWVSGRALRKHHGEPLVFLALILEVIGERIYSGADRLLTMPASSGFVLAIVRTLAALTIAYLVARLVL